MRLDDTPQNLAGMVEALSNVDIPDEGIKTAMVHLRVMVNASAERDEKALKEAQAFFALPPSPFHKVITVLSFGGSLSKNVSMALDMFAKDNKAAAKLMTAEQKNLWNDRSLDIRNMIDDDVGFFKFRSAASWKVEKTLAGVVMASFHRPEMICAMACKSNARRRCGPRRKYMRRPG